MLAMLPHTNSSVALPVWGKTHNDKSYTHSFAQAIGLLVGWDVCALGNTRSVKLAVASSAHKKVWGLQKHLPHRWVPSR